MSYSFDGWGWLSAGEIPGRTTSVEPPAHGDKTVGQPYPNFTGHEWVLVNYVEPVPYVPPVVVPPWEWFIDIGPFMDRFGPAHMAVLMSTEPVVMAFRLDMLGRKWIDLQRPDVAAALGYMAGATIPDIGTIATPVAGMTVARVTAILTTPVTEEENRALRKVYFS